MADRLLIVDFGSQVTQLIARRVREAGVYCEIHPFQSVDEAKIDDIRPQGHHPLRRPRLGDRRPVARRQSRHLHRQACRCWASATASRPWPSSWAARSRAATTASSAAPRSRSRPDSALFDGVWQPGDRKQVWMSHGDRVTRLPPGFSRRRHQRERALRRHRRREAPLLRRAVPPRGGAHARRRQASAQLRAQHRRLQRRLDHGGLPRARHRPDPRPGRQGQGDLRPVGRRRLLGRGRAAARGDRRPAALRVRRPRPAAQGRGRAGRAPVPRPLQHPAGPCRRLASCS